MSQLERIKSHLSSGQSITALEALGVYGCYRLAARINELRDRGMPIDMKTCTDAMGRRYARYTAQPLRVWPYVCR